MNTANSKNEHILN